MNYEQAIKRILKKLGYDLIIHKFPNGSYEAIIPKKDRIDSFSRLRQDEQPLPVRPLIRTSAKSSQRAMEKAISALGKELNK